jgi:single-stranded DNA-binding protein
MSTFAKFYSLGRLGSDVVDHGNYISFILIADRTVFKNNKYSSEPQSFHMKVLTRLLGNFVKKYVGKGDLIFVEAKPDFSSYKKKNGEVSYGKSFIVDTINLAKKSPNAPKDAEGKYIAPKVTDKTTTKKDKPKQETEEYDFVPEKDELEESTGNASLDEEESDDDFFDLDGLEL